MLSATSVTAIKQTIEEVVERGALPTSFRELLAIPLRQPGKIMAEEGNPQWAALVLAACTSTGGDPTWGAVAAAAAELFMAGLDVLDEVEDGDQSALIEAAGEAQALNVSTALLLLGQQTLLGLAERGMAPDRVALLGRALTEAGIAATGGQHRDLANAAAGAVSTDEALDIARRKAGVLVAGACRLGALIGTADEDLLALYSVWGMHYGTAAQLANDLHDAENAEDKSDVVRQKGTLPLLYARGSGALLGAGPAPLAGSGALHFTWVILEIERQRCVQLLDTLATHGHAIAAMRDLLGRVG